MPRKKLRPEPAPAKRKMPAGLAKPVQPSADLAAIVGVKPLTRAKATAAMWTYIKAHGLQDPADRRTIIADDKLRPLFERDRIGMFELAGILGRHLTAA